MNARQLMLGVAIVSLAGFLFITIYAAIDRGFTILSALSILIFFVLGVGIVGGLVEYARHDDE